MTAVMSSASIHFGTSRLLTSGTHDGAPRGAWLYTDEPWPPASSAAKRSRASRAVDTPGRSRPSPCRIVRRGALARTASPTGGWRHPPRRSFRSPRPSLVIGRLAGGDRAIVRAEIGDVRAEHDTVRRGSRHEGDRRQQLHQRESILAEGVLFPSNHPLDVARVLRTGIHARAPATAMSSHRGWSMTMIPISTKATTITDPSAALPVILVTIHQMPTASGARIS